jgi:hypothetical protein
MLAVRKTSKHSLAMGLKSASQINTADENRFNSSSLLQLKKHGIIFFCNLHQQQPRIRQSENLKTDANKTLDS